MVWIIKEPKANTVKGNKKQTEINKLLQQTKPQRAAKGEMQNGDPKKNPQKTKKIQKLKYITNHNKKRHEQVWEMDGRPKNKEMTEKHKQTN